MLNLAAKRMDSAALVVLVFSFMHHFSAPCCYLFPFISYSFHSFLPTLDLLQVLIKQF